MSNNFLKRIPQDGDIKTLSITQPHKVSNWTSRHITNVKRWRNKGNYPDWAIELVAIKAGYFPWADWEGWKFDNGYIFSPNLRYGFKPQDIENIHFIKQHYEQLERELMSLNNSYFIINYSKILEILNIKKLYTTICTRLRCAYRLQLGNIFDR